MNEEKEYKLCNQKISDIRVGAVLGTAMFFSIVLLVCTLYFNVIIRDVEYKNISLEKKIICMENGFEDFTSFYDGEEYCIMGTGFAILKSKCNDGLTMFNIKECDYKVYFPLKGGK